MLGHRGENVLGTGDSECQVGGRGTEKTITLRPAECKLERLIGDKVRKGGGQPDTTHIAFGGSCKGFGLCPQSRSHGWLQAEE